MEWEIIVALVMAIPVILLPVAFVWFLNIDGLCTSIKKTRIMRTASRRRTEAVLEAK